MPAAGDLCVGKRDGRIVPFDGERIRRAVAAAFRAEAGLAGGGELPAETAAAADGIAADVAREVLNRAADGDQPGIESIQDLVERHLMEAGWHGVAKRYILYREEDPEAQEEGKAPLRPGEAGAGSGRAAGAGGVGGG